jgi:hypothetical protein
MRTAVIGITLCAAFAAFGCGASQTKWNAEAAQYAVYAMQVPLFAGTEIEDAMGHESWGDEPDSYSYGMTWWCKTTGTKDEIVAFYERALPGARKEVDEDGGVTLTVIPEAAGPREDMGVYVTGDGEYRVFEHTKAKKPGT